MPRVSFTKAQNELSIVWPQLYFGLGFTTLATLILALSLDRIFVALALPAGWFAIAASLAGLGAGAAFARRLAEWTGDVWSKLGWVALLNSLVLVAALTFILSHEHMTAVVEASIFLAALLAFAGSGTVVATVLTEAAKGLDKARLDRARLDKALIAAFSGAAAGCLLLVPLLNLFAGAPNTVLASGAIFAISAAIWSHQAGGNARRASAVLMALLFTWVMVVNGKMHLIDVRSGTAVRPVGLGPLIALILSAMALSLARWQFRKTAY